MQCVHTKCYSSTQIMFCGQVNKFDQLFANPVCKERRARVPVHCRLGFRKESFVCVCVCLERPVSIAPYI